MSADVQYHRGYAATIGNNRAALNDEGFRARAARADGRQSKTAIGRLLEQLTAPPAIGEDGAIRSKGPENVLYVQRGHGTPPEPHWGQVVAYLRAVAQGEDADEVLEDMHARRRDAQHVQPSLAVEQGLYREAETAGPQAREAQSSSRPALPSAPAPAAEPLPQRDPEHVEHVDEDPKWSTMQAGEIALLGEAKGVLKPLTVQRLHDEGYGTQRKAAAPDMGPAAPARFAASAVRIGDTQPMRMDEVLGHLAQADAGAEADGDPEPRPFSGTGLSGDASPARESGAGDDDES